MEWYDRPDLAERLKGAIPAATLIVMRPGAVGASDDAPDEILMVERSKRVSFASGMVAFPGGRVDPEDRNLADRIAPDMSTFEAAARIAAIRETFEETGLLCALSAAPGSPTPDGAEITRARREWVAGTAFDEVLTQRDWSLDLDALTPFTRWCPPSGIEINRRFDARFYLVRFAGDPPVTADGTENVATY